MNGSDPVYGAEPAVTRFEYRLHDPDSNAKFSHRYRERKFPKPPIRHSAVLLLVLFLALACTLPVVSTLVAPASEQPTTLPPSPVPPTDQAPATGPDIGSFNPNPPSRPVKLIFIHHSTGGHWLADDNGGLGIALRDNNYYVSATNYGWGPYSIGDRTDIPNWPEWFTGPNSATILGALYTENGQNFSDFGAWSRLKTDPGGENQIIMFKSCFPNSDLYGNPDDPPYPEPNDWEFSVSNAKAVYNKILTYFATRQDKLFVVITAPPLMQSETAPARAVNARAFNNWLVNDWLDGYPYNNVAVFDYYSILTSNGSPGRVDDPGMTGEPNDLGWADGNHHRWQAGAVQHIQTVDNNYSAYPSGDSHPTAAGHQKATGEFVKLLNIFYHRWQSGVASAHSVYLPLTAKGATGPAPTPTPPPPPGDLLQPADLVYLGAFRLPDGGVRPLTFAYGGNAMTFNPNGDPAGPADGFPGSLFITGHDRMPYGELPDGSQVAEVNIPVPVNSRNLNDLPVAAFLQGFSNVTAGHFTRMDEIVRIGMAYLDHPATGARIHLAWGQHFEPDPPAATHAWFSPNLAAPNFQGEWFIGSQSFYAVNDYMFEIPMAWADAHAQGRYLATGRFRDGGWSGMGPALFAYRPWIDQNGTPAPSGTHLAETVLLLYESSLSNETIEHCLNGYQHPDEWAGGAWLTSGSKTAVLFAGTKSNGTKYWYGYVNPAGPQFPCVDAEVTDFITCRLANGSPCPAADLTECAGHNDYRGWWTTRWDAEFILYNPADMARVAAGEIPSWEPQPYATLDVDEYLFLNPAGIEEDMLGTGVQRRYRIGDVAYDRSHHLLYVLEWFADEARPVVHVWRVGY